VILRTALDRLDAATTGSRAAPTRVGFFAAVLPAFLAAFFVAGCDGLGSSGAPPAVVLEAYYISGENLGAVRLSRTASIDGVYDLQTLAVRDAAVRVELFASDGSVEEVFDYEYAYGSVYQATDGDAVAQPGSTYRVIAELADGEVVSAETTVPGAFEIRRISATSVEYQSAEQLEFDVTRSFVAGRQAIFVFSTEAGDPRAEMLTPLYAEIVGDDIEQVRITESPPVNEENYDVNGDGTLTIRLPWLAVAFYGPNEVIASSIDDNLYDFLRSQFVQQGGSTFAPGEIPNVIEHVEGGTGIFGSLSRVSAQVEIRRETDGDP
jgi:hypothetical protein